MEQIAINILPKGAKPVCHSSQFDDGRQIRFNLFNDATPYTLSGTETISVLVRKPDGTEVIDSVTNTSDSYVIWEVSTDACELSGVCECELSIVENGIVLGSKNFTMKVEEDAYGGRNIEVRTASGRIATFSTNMAEAFKSLVSEINPVQDLHGYSKPWSGGGGKNKLENTSTVTSLNSVTFTKNEDGSVKLTGTASAAINSTYINFFTLPSGTYIFTDGTTSTNCYLYLLIEGSGTWYKNGDTFTVDGNTRTRVVAYVANGSATNLTLYPMIRLASVSDASFEPYENICPISGFNALNVTRTGKNLFSYDLTIRDGYWTNNAFVGTNAIVPKENAMSWQYIRVYVEGLSSITLSGFDNQGGTNCAWLSSENVNDVISRFNSLNKNGTKTVPSGAKYVCLTMFNIKDRSTIYPNAQLEIGNQATDFEPYNGQTATVNFGQTVYGGSLDVTNGVLTITHEYCVFNGTETITSNQQGGHTRFSCQKLVNLANENASNENFCSHFIPSTEPLGQNRIDNAISVYRKGLYWRADQFTDETAMKNYLLAQYNANTPVMYVAKLATPIEIDTTPENLTALLGQNNVYGNTNGDTEVEYYIEV